MKFVLTLLFILLIKISSSHIYTDSTFQKNNTVYSINDPLNPDCPCHAYQKKAEEEYDKSLAKPGKEKRSEPATAIAYRTTASAAAIKTKTQNKFLAKKYFFKINQKLKRFFDHPKRFKTDYRFCVRW